MLAELLGERIRVEIGPEHPNYDSLMDQVKIAYQKVGLPFCYQADQSANEATLAEWVCEFLNMCSEHGIKIDREMYEALDHDLEDSGYYVDYNRKERRWNVVPMNGEPDRSSKEGELYRYLAYHAPMGGIQVGGEVFRGGQWIPGKMMEGVSEQEAMRMGLKKGPRSFDHVDDNRAKWLSDKYRRTSEEVQKEKQAQIKARYEAIERRHGKDAKKRLAEHAHQLHAQVGKASGAGRAALVKELGQTIGMLSVAGGEVPQEDVPEEAPDEVQETKKEAPQEAEETDEVEPEEVDQALWNECRKVIPSEKPDRLPTEIGTVDGHRVIAVDANQVMVEHDMDFNNANNFVETPEYIPDGEIWLAGNVDVKEWSFNLYHECVEVRYMKAGDSYEKAHAKANAVEKVLRTQALEVERSSGLQQETPPGPEPLSGTLGGRDDGLLRGP